MKTMETTTNNTSTNTLNTEVASWQISARNDRGSFVVEPRGYGYVRFSVKKAGEKSPAWTALRRVSSGAELKALVRDIADLVMEARNILVLAPDKSRGLYLAVQGDRVKKAAWDNWTGLAALESAVEEMIQDHS